MIARFALLICLAACGFAAAVSPARALGLVQLTTNGRANPLGIAADHIAFGWAMTADSRDVVQTAYQLRVGAAPGLGDVWESGHVKSDREVGVALPESVKLSPATRYFWQVRVWDARGGESAWSEPAWFETGLLSKADWDGAEWITGAPDSLPLLRGTFEAKKDVRSARVYASALGVYQLSLNG
jgi:alpha-L-rhamnosidase